MKKPILSPDFAIEDIHKLRKYNYVPIRLIVTILLSLFCTLTLLIGCSDQQNKFILDELLPENIETVEVRIYQYAKINDRELDSTTIAELKKWIEQLSLEHRIFKDGQTPGSDADGGYAYEFIINDGMLSFEYKATDVNYIWYDGEWYEITNKNISEPPIGESEARLWDLIPMVMINGELYLDTGYEVTEKDRAALMDGKITSEVDGSEQPTENDQSNFGTGYEYQYGTSEGLIEIHINDKWFVFATEKALKNNTDVVE